MAKLTNVISLSSFQQNRAAVLLNTFWLYIESRTEKIKALIFDPSIKTTLLLDMIETFIIACFWFMGLLFTLGMCVAFYYSMRAYMSFF